MPTLLQGALMAVPAWISAHPAGADAAMVGKSACINGDSCLILRHFIGGIVQPDGVSAFSAQEVGFYPLFVVAT